MQGWVIVLVAVAYVTLLFAIASIGDRRAARGWKSRPRPLIYALSLAIYCTSWTFFGSVGLASERGFEFLAIYIGPVIVFLFGFPLLRRIIRLAKSERITSIADFLGARYGKSFAVASTATLIATMGTVPYIALQLKAISDSVSLMVGHYNGTQPGVEGVLGDVSLVVAVLLALFAILFGTRHADATEHQDGLILAVAVESIVKLAAFLAVGIAVSFALFGGLGSLIGEIQSHGATMAAYQHQTSLASWLVMIALSASAIIMLPRQFYVTIVENRSESELRRAGWLFPLYLLLINIFVIPIAFAGILTLGGSGANADLFVVSVPLHFDQDALALVAFVGGLSAATAMVIVASVSLSIMISNDLVIPVFLRGFLREHALGGEDFSQAILNIRRGAIFIILFAAFLYYREITNNMRLASIGLISFAAIAQFAPSFFGGMVWRGANARGALIGMIAGMTLWAYTLLFPSLAPPDTAIVASGLFGLEALRPHSLFGTGGDSLVHGTLWSLSVNTLFFVLGSLSRSATPLERIQAALFVPRDANPMPSLRRFRTTVTVDDLKDTIARYLGAERTERSFQAFEIQQGLTFTGHEAANMTVMRFSEQLLTSAIGSSSARLVLSLLIQRFDRNEREAMRLLDDASEALQHNRDLLQIALDQMEQGITVFDRDFQLICWNRQYRSLFHLPDSMGRVGVSLDGIFRHLADRGDIAHETIADAINRLASFHPPWQLELARSGHIIELRSNPMPDGGIVATYADVTARVEADQALKRVNETLENRVERRTAELMRLNEELAQAQMLAEEANLGKTRFLAAAGHDILQPLNAARLYCASLSETVGPGPVGSAVGNIESSLDSVETILGAVLDISRLDTGALEPVPTTFRLEGLLRQIATDFQPLANEKGIELTIVSSGLAVGTDRNLLRRLIQNLVSNAIKYTRTGRILVGVRRRGGLAEVQVHDTGIGIEAEKLNEVFREFTRLEEGMREAQGLGLGLSIVDRIARVLRLEIRIHSRKEEGSCFSVLVPISETQEVALAAPARVHPGGDMRLDGLCVLCIDNEPTILDGMRRLLETWGCRVELIPRSGELDRLAATGFVPDVILADYHLDGEDGLSVIGKARMHWHGALPAALVTADRSNEVRLAAGRYDVPLLHKPVKPAALRTLLTRFTRLPSAAE